MEAINALYPTRRIFKDASFKPTAVGRQGSDGDDVVLLDRKVWRSIRCDPNR